MASTDEEFLILPDGRTLAYSIFGSSSAETTMFYFHGFPATHWEGLFFHSAALRNDIRLISASRPGFGKSSHDPNRTLLDWPADVLALADHLNVQRFGIVGASGGAPYVFACLKQMPLGRLAAAGVVGGLFPPSVGWSDMPLFTRGFFIIAPWLPGLIAWAVNYQLRKMRAAEDAALAKDGTYGTMLEEHLDNDMKKRPPVDAELWYDKDLGFRDALLSSGRAFIRSETGGQATVHEAKLFGSPWGLELGVLSIEKNKLLLWHGSEDANVPLRMAKEGAKLLGDAVELRVYVGEGHISLIKKGDEILLALKDLMRD